MISISHGSKWIWAIIGFGLFAGSLKAEAATPIQFSKADLDSFLTLMKPERITLRLDGREGVFNPGPSLLFAGLEPQNFDINLDLGSNLVDLRFNDLRAKAPSLTFEKDRIRIEVRLADQDKAIRSLLGAVNLRGVKAVAWLTVSAENGVRITYEKGMIQGELKGTGLLKPRWVIDAIRKISMNALKTQIERMLARPTFQASIAQGFVTWAQFSEDQSLTRIAPSSLGVSENGISYQAE